VVKPQYRLAALVEIDRYKTAQRATINLNTYLAFYNPTDKNVEIAGSTSYALKIDASTQAAHVELTQT